MAGKAADVLGKGTAQPAADSASGLDVMQQIFDLAKNQAQDPEHRDWMETIMPHISVLSHSAALPHPRVTFRFTVQPAHCNGLSNLHGGCTATLFDFATTMPICFLSKPGFWEYLGVSRTLNTTYLRPIPCGMTIEIDTELLQIGKRMATIRGAMYAVNPDGSRGPLLAVCEHGKACADPPKM